MLGSEQRHPSCAVPAQLAGITTTYSDLPQLTLLTGGGGYIRRGLRRHALKLALIRKPREHNNRVSVHACGGIFGSIRSVGLRCG